MRKTEDKFSVRQGDYRQNQYRPTYSTCSCHTSFGQSIVIILKVLEICTRAHGPTLILLKISAAEAPRLGRSQRCLKPSSWNGKCGFADALGPSTSSISEPWLCQCLRQKQTSDGDWLINQK